VTEEIGLFPLELVLLPTERVPLHVFEERYKELVGECVREGREFGLLLSSDAGLAEVGTRAAVTEVLQELPDGRMNVIVEGGARFRLVDLTDGRAFQTAEVEPVEDEDEPPDDDEIDKALEVFRRIVELTDSSGVDEPDRDSPLLAFELAARIDFGPELKQELLEIRSPRERIVRLTELLERAAEAIALEREVQERASKNGKVIPFKPDESL
jgi:Lon protease-like protein